MSTLIFNGISKPYLTTLRGGEYPSWAPVEREIIRVPALPGGYLSRTQTKERVLKVPVLLDSHEFQNFELLKEELASWLFTEEATELSFSDEPNRVYYAVVDGSLDIEKIISKGTGVITFICPDPFKYGQEETANFPSDAVAITTEGTADADPIFEMEVLEPVTFAMIQNQDEQYQMIGIPADDDMEVVDSREIIFNQGTSMDGWGYKGTTVDPISGDISDGTMTHDGTGILVSDYDSPQSDNAYGPAIIRELPETLQDFEISTVIDTRTDTLNQNFRVEIYGFDENMNMLGKIGIQDGNRDLHERVGLARIGEYVNSQVRYMIGSNNFRFINSGPALTFFIRWKREGETFEVNIYRIVNGEYRNWTRRRYTDTSEDFLGRLKFIQVYIRTFQDRPNPTLARVNQLKVEKLYQVNDDQTPYIAYPGDVITFDHKDDEILINGEDRKDLKDFGGDYFKLKKGENQLIVQPSDSFSTSVKYRDRFR
ncbi:distal tail protein Dit [Salipaludibacillus sp. HK11]|uniref:distal tail protein Dit n=1 Tax=Salipaludibacillus sp. HK11 TaxID=3394320 RepID=UPI0039FC918B